MTVSPDMVQLLLFAGGLAAGAMIVALFLYPRLVRLRAENSYLAQHDESFRAIAQDVMKASQEQLLLLTQEKLNTGQQAAAHELEKRQTAIGALVDPVQKTLTAMDEKLKQLEEARLSAYSELRTQLGLLAQDQGKLRAETLSLAQALKSTGTRGQWGEIQLKRCLDMAGLQQGVHYDMQATQTGDEGQKQRPDVIIHLPGGKNLIIDAKVPMAAYLAAFADGVEEAQQKQHLAAHARALRDHIKALSQKAYWDTLDSPEFVILFLPGESYFSAALQADPHLLEAGVEQRVIPASPTTLISLCKAVMYGWKQEKMADNARHIAELGQDLYKRLTSFTGHLDKMGDRLEGAVKSYNDTIGSLERMVLPQARKFKELGADKGDTEIPYLKVIESLPRPPVKVDKIAEE